jgi:hypothetical protein
MKHLFENDGMFNLLDTDANTWESWVVFNGAESHRRFAPVGGSVTFWVKEYQDDANWSETVLDFAPIALLPELAEGTHLLSCLQDAYNALSALRGSQVLDIKVAIMNKQVEITGGGNWHWGTESRASITRLNSNKYGLTRVV